MKECSRVILIIVSLAGTAQADFPPVMGELAVQLNMADHTMTLQANQANEILGMKITSPLNALIVRSGPFGIVFFVQTNSTTSVYEEGTISFTNVNGSFDLTELYDFSNGPDFNLDFQYTNFDFGLVSGDVQIVVGSACDFNSDSACNLLDINQMYSDNGYNLVNGVATTTATKKFDLVDDNVIDNLDITEWLSQAGDENGYVSPYLRGDTDGLNMTFDPNAPTRTADITDFQDFLIGFTGVGVTWEVGNFDGDNDVGITDFSTHFLPNFLATGGGTYGPNQSTPEPSAMVLWGVGGVLLACALYRKRCSY